MNTFPLIYYPSTIALIDDDPLLLQSLSNLIETSYNTLEFVRPQHFTALMAEYSGLLPSLKLLRGCTELENYDVSQQLPADLDYQLIRNLRNNAQNMTEISVIIVDYNMNEINGIDVCRQLADSPIKKILLTGHADDKIAIKAFNEGIIDAYIKKDSPTLVADIQSALKKLSALYFSDQTKPLLQHLELEQSLPASDHLFNQFYLNWCQQQNITHYYLIDSRANFIATDSSGKTYYFIVHTDETLNAFLRHYEDNKEASAFTDLIKSKTKLPFFGEGINSWDITIPEWNDYFYIPRVFEGRESYYYFVITKL
jgi:CheY-like chemotaxis protein